jgi:hypothetical protein
MDLLLKRGAHWKYFINTVGTALPGRPIQQLLDGIITNLKGLLLL